VTPDVRHHRQRFGATGAERSLRRRFNRSDVNHLLKMRDPTRSRDVAVEVDDTSRESFGDHA